MKALLTIASALFRQEKRAFLRGILLSVTVLAMGMALLAVSGWFITATAAAGLAGIGILFNVFAPSAMIRLLAIGRTAARYGERLTTHDATLRGLSRLRIRLLQNTLHAPYRALERLRANAMLNRVTADVDALDGLALRLLLPGLAGLIVIAATSVVVALLVHPAIAAVLLIGYGILPTALFLIGQRMARKPSRNAEAAMQALRSRLIDLIAGRDDLAVFGRIGAMLEQVTSATQRHAASRRQLDRIERRTGFALDVTAVSVTGLTLFIGGTLAEAGAITPARAAIGIFAALALSETTAPIRRALTEIGRMVQAARRVAPALDEPPTSHGLPGQTIPMAPELSLVDVCATHHGKALFAPISLTVSPGETVALRGPSGSGKSTLLLIARGVLHGTGSVCVGGRPFEEMPPAQIDRMLALLPQRHALIAGTVAENLRLAAPEATDNALWEALDVAQLETVIREKGGLDHRLGFRGAGLSGGEARRLAVARIILKDPNILLLDEPTEGLDAPTARALLKALRNALPQAAILVAAHREAELSWADRVQDVVTIPRV